MISIKEAKKEVAEHILESKQLQDVLEGISILKHLREVARPLSTDWLDSNENLNSKEK